MIYILSIITIAALVFIGVDVAAQLSEWQARIGIGKWSDREAWQAALESRARKWLKRSPTVRISDSRRWVLLDILRGKYRSGTIQAWQDAGLLLGLGSGESERYASLKTDPATGDWKNKPEHVDSALLAYALKKNGALPAAAEHAVVELLYTLKGNQKTIPYRKELPNIRFVDTIGMTAPFLTLCGLDELADAQIGEYDRALLHDSCIPPHAYDICRDVPAGIYDWARGTGWYILGLIESNTDGRFNDCIVALSNELLRYQKPEGGFGAMYFNPVSPFEASGSALIGLLMIRGYGIIRNPKFLEAAFGIEKRLMASTRRSGALDNCQGDTMGVGYYSHTFSVMPFAQGIALRMSKELNEYADR